jgi:hypothetical protein
MGDNTKFYNFLFFSGTPLPNKAVLGWPVPVSPSSSGERSTVLADVENEEPPHSELPDLEHIFGGPFFEEELCDGLVTYFLAQCKTPSPKKNIGEQQQQQQQRVREEWREVGRERGREERMEEEEEEEQYQPQREKEEQERDKVLMLYSSL